MNIEQANNLKAKDIILDESGDEHVFISLDEDNDLIVECRPAMGGKVHLYRTHCTIPD